MTWSITAAGTVTLDDITTPAGRRTGLLGGSAVYFSLGAARHAPVSAVGVAGEDARPLLETAFGGHRIDWSRIEWVPGPSLSWTAVHDFEQWTTRSEAMRLGPYAEWRPRLDGAAASAEVLFVGSMPPATQARVVGTSRATLVGADSMASFITADRGAVRALAAAVDVLFLDRREVRALVGADVPRSSEPWVDDAASLLGEGRLRAVVVKGGPAGVTLVARHGVVRRPAAAIGAVVDPTGAGDAFAGGFLGACAAAGRADDDQLIHALDAGLRSAAQAIGAFGVAALLD